MIRITQGDDRRIFIKVRDEKGDPVNISDATQITFAVARSAGSPLLIEKRLTEGDITITGNDDEFYFDLEADETGAIARGSYQYEAEVITAGGLVYTINRDAFVVVDQIIPPEE